MQIKDSSVRNKLAAWMLLLLWISFSATPPLLHLDFNKDNTPEQQQTTVDFLKQLSCNHLYNVPNIKYDFGKIRSFTPYIVSSNNWALQLINLSPKVLQTHAEIHFSTLSIPAYLFNRILRI